MKKWTLSFGLGLLVTWALSVSAWAAPTTGSITELMGNVTIKKAAGQTVKAVLKATVVQGDQIITAANSKCTVLFPGGSVLRLGPSSTVKITQLVQPSQGVVQAVYNVAAGTVMSVVGSIFGNSGSSYQVTTPTAVSGVKSTMYIIKVGIHPTTGQLTTLAVGVEGTTNFQGSNGGSYDLGPHWYSVAGPDGIASAPGQMSDADFQALLLTVQTEVRSLDERANQIRTQAGFVNTGEGSGAFIPPDLVLPEGGGDSDLNSDNPFDLIYQEPTQATELIIIIDLGMP